MSFLKFDEHTRKITVTLEAEDLAVVKLLRDKDTTEDKRFYYNALSYVYHVYKKDHFFANLSINERKTMAEERESKEFSILAVLSLTKAVFSHRLNSYMR